MAPSEQQALLDAPSLTRLQRWLAVPTSAKPTAELTERLSHVLVIYTRLHVLLPEDKQADAWLKAPNQAPLFEGKSALMFILEKGLPGLAAVNQYLVGKTDGVC